MPSSCATETQKTVTLIRDAEWRQCSVFRPASDLISALPVYMMLGENEYLLVATQTCSLVSHDLDKERLVEVIAAKPLEKYNPRHSRATGAESVFFHLPLSGHLRSRGIEAVECDMGRRAFVARSQLALCTPETTWCEPANLNAFKGWIANYYTRVALPDALVERLKAKPGGIVTQIDAWLKEDLASGRVADGVKSFFISWAPDSEVPKDKAYTISIIVACSDLDTVDFLERKLSEIISSRMNALSVEGVMISDCIVDVDDNITLAQLSGKFRFGNWESLSNADERLDNQRKSHL